MAKFFTSLGACGWRIYDLFPRRLPIGRAEFDDYCSFLFLVHNLPDLPSYRNAVATMVMHLGPTVSRKAPYYFVTSIRKAQANEVAYAVIQEMRALEKQKQAEETATLKSVEPVSS